MRVTQLTSRDRASARDDSRRERIAEAKARIARRRRMAERRANAPKSREERLSEARARIEARRARAAGKAPVSNDFNTVIANYKKVKEARLGTSKLTYKEVKTLRDAVNRANRLGQKLKEADPNFDATAQDPNAAAGGAAPADPNAAAGGAVSPDIQTQIQTLLQQVQDLATSAGVQLNDLGANPSADIPPVDGTQQPAADAAAGAPADQTQPMVEAVAKVRKANNGKCDEASFTKIHESFKDAITKKFGQTKDRIAIRAAKLECMNESYKGDFASAYFNSIGLKEATSPIEGIPAESAIAKGTTDAKGKLASELHTPVAWPDHAVTGAAIQGEGARQQKVKESVSSEVDDTYVENFYADKLSFEKIKESMKSGNL